MQSIEATRALAAKALEKINARLAGPHKNHARLVRAQRAAINAIKALDKVLKKGGKN